ncbi:MAG TPA: hypothetical protein VM554_02645 [Acidisarcina sp.]|nr:hypothetical protein [Acidisarcina sp.]
MVGAAVQQDRLVSADPISAVAQVFVILAIMGHAAPQCMGDGAIPRH